MVNRHICPSDNADLSKERSTCTFDTDALAAEIQGGRAQLQKRMEISAKIAGEPAFRAEPLEFMTREERIEQNSRLAKEVAERAAGIAEYKSVPETQQMILEVMGIDGSPFNLHYDMFLPTLEGQADDEQQAQWLGRARRHEIMGTYAQTELGHGTSVRDLETTANFDRDRDEFVLHTPSYSAMKWWPGNLGKVTNYAIVVGQLIIDGRRLGPHNFLLQTRDEKTHRTLPGIELGDIGPKFGLNTIDNGFMKLTNVRIPRRQMMMRHATVSRDGKYTQPKHAKIGYATMVFVRSWMCRGQGMFLARAATIATRYSAVRRQGRIGQSDKEVQVLDYQTQQHRLFPQIARACAFIFAGDELKNLYERAMADVSNGNMDLLPDLHALSSGLKSVVTHLTGLGIEQCREGCGGHGYSMASGLPQIYTSAIAGCTYEGENMVMLQQAARYLVKAVAGAGSGRTLPASIAYLARADMGHSLLGQMECHDGEIDEMLRALEHAAARVTRQAATSYLKTVQSGKSSEQNAWNEHAVEMTRAARLHTRLYIAGAFVRRVRGASDHGVRAVLEDVLSLYLRYELVDLAHHLLEDGFVRPHQIAYLKQRLYEDLGKLRPNAVSIVDSFEFSDRELHSVLGRKDGNVYDALYSWAKQSELNRSDVLPFYNKHLKPMMDHGREMSKI